MAIKPSTRHLVVKDNAVVFAGNRTNQLRYFRKNGRSKNGLRLFCGYDDDKVGDILEFKD